MEPSGPWGRDAQARQISGLPAVVGKQQQQQQSGDGSSPRRGGGGSSATNSISGGVTPTAAPASLPTGSTSGTSGRLASAGAAGAAAAVQSSSSSSGGRGALRALLGGRWCVSALEVENQLSGVTYCFAAPPGGAWVGEGEPDAVRLERPAAARTGDAAALAALEAELSRQLARNAALDERQRTALETRLAAVRAAGAVATGTSNRGLALMRAAPAL